MTPWPWRPHPSAPGHRLAAVFVVLVLLPGVVLSVFALRTLLREGALARQQVHQRLEAAAAQTGRQVSMELEQWQQALATAALARANPDALPEMIGRGLSTPGAAVLVWLNGPEFRAFPTDQLLYLPSAVSSPGSPSDALPPSLARAESIELAEKDYALAIRAYQALLRSSTAEWRAPILHRLARTQRKAGRLNDAIRTYQELGREAPADAGPLPWDFVARSELGSLAAQHDDGGDTAAQASAFCLDLVRRRWLLEKTRYVYYAGRCRSWFTQGPLRAADLARFQAEEQNHLALTRVVEELMSAPKGVVHVGTRTYVAVWRPEPFAALVFSADFLERDWWPRVAAIAEGQDMAAALDSPDGRPIVGAAAEQRSPLAVVRAVQVGPSPCRLHVWPRDPAALDAALRRTQYLYAGVLTFVVALLGIGSYTTARSLKRELEIGRMRADFVSTVSHEFRSPLTGIRQLAEMLLDGRVAGEGKQRRYYRLIVQESDRLGRLVENVLDFSRMEEGRREYRFAPLDTSAWLQGLVEAFQAEIAGAGVSVAASIGDGLPRISADGEALGCALRNLLDNAVKYSPGSTVVELTARADAGFVHIAVTDHGVGIPERDQPHVFDRFYRVDGPTSRTVKGAGLGLSLVKHIVTAHGGTVHVESQVGNGSTFAIRLPTAPGGAEE